MSHIHLNTLADKDIDKETVMEKIAVVILTYKRIKRLERCLNNLIEARGFDQVKIVVIIDNRDYDTEIFVKENYSQYRNIFSYILPKGSRGGNRNYAINLVDDGDIIYFLDDDVIVKEDVFEIIWEKFKRYKNVPIIGGPNLTPTNSSFFQKCQGYVLSSSFATAWVSQRYKVLKKDKLTDERNLILCNLATKRKVFLESNVYFNDNLVSNEETLLLQKLKEKGYKALYTPELVVYHERRRNLLEFCKQIFSYGRGRCQNIRNFPKSFSLIYIIPSLFIIYLVSLLIYRAGFYVFGLYLYFLLGCFSSLVIAIRERNLAAFFMVLFLHPLIHVVYGFGFILEIFNKRIQG